MKKCLVSSVCFLLNFSLLNCHPDVLPSCEVSKPLEELSWLKAIVDDGAWRPNQHIRIDQAFYKGHQVYQVENSMAVDAGITVLYDCQGNILCQGNTTIAGFRSDCKNIFDEVKTKILLYQR